MCIMCPHPAAVASVIMHRKTVASGYRDVHMMIMAHIVDETHSLAANTFILVFGTFPYFTFTPRRCIVHAVHLSGSAS